MPRCGQGMAVMWNDTENAEDNVYSFSDIGIHVDVIVGIVGKLLCVRCWWGWRHGVTMGGARSWMGQAGH